MHYPLANARRQEILSIGADRPNCRYQHHGNSRKSQHTGVALTKSRPDQSAEPGRYSFGAEHMIEHDLKWPGFEQVHSTLDENGYECDREPLPVRPEEVCYLEFVTFHLLSRHAA